MKRLNLGVIKFVSMYERVGPPYLFCWDRTLTTYQPERWQGIAAIPPLSFCIQLIAKLTGHWLG